MAWVKQERALVATAAVLVFSRVFGLSVVLPNFRVHYSESLGLTGLWLGVAFSAYGLTMALMQLPNGVLSDRFGRRAMMLSGTALFVGGSLMAAFANDSTSLIVARLLQGMGAVGSVAMAAVGETIPAARRTTAMALVGIPAGLGFLVGVAAGPLLYPSIGMSGLFLLTAAIGALPALGLLRLHIAAPAARPAALAKPLAAPMLWLAAAGFCTNYLLTTTLFLLPDSTWQTLLPILAVALVGVALVSRAIDKSWLTWQPVAIALAFLGGSAALYVLTPGYGFWIGGAMFFFLHAVLSTTLPSNVSRLAGPRGGRGHGIQSVVAYSGTFLAGPVAGLLTGRPEITIIVPDVMAVVTAVALFVVFRRLPQASRTPSAEAEATA